MARRSSRRSSGARTPVTVIQFTPVTRRAKRGATSTPKPFDAQKPAMRTDTLTRLQPTNILKTARALAAMAA